MLMCVLYIYIYVYSDICVCESVLFIMQRGNAFDSPRNVRFHFTRDMIKIFRLERTYLYYNDYLVTTCIGRAIIIHSRERSKNST